MYGWFTYFKILTYSIANFFCLPRIKFLFLSAFKAYNFPVYSNFARNTFPNAPDPNSFIKVKLENCILSEDFKLEKSGSLSKSSSIDFDFYNSLVLLSSSEVNEVLLSGNWLEVMDTLDIGILGSLIESREGSTDLLI